MIAEEDTVGLELGAVVAADVVGTAAQKEAWQHLSRRRHSEPPSHHQRVDLEVEL